MANRIKTDNIFDMKNGFSCLGNYYRSHLAWIKFEDKINSFVNEKKYSCDGDCANCLQFEEHKLDLGNNMKPKLGLEDYNFDSTTGQIKKPDFRSKYCHRALTGECVELDCTECQYFEQNAYIRYLLIHTLKHALLWAMPKYAGVSITDLKGEIYPNDNNDK